MDTTSPEFEDLRQGDCVKVRVGNERIWFQVLSFVDSPSNAVICRLDNTPLYCVFDGRVTIDRSWIVETIRAADRPKLHLVGKELPR